MHDKITYALQIYTLFFSDALINYFTVQRLSVIADFYCKSSFYSSQEMKIGTNNIPYTYELCISELSTLDVT